MISMSCDATFTNTSPTAVAIHLECSTGRFDTGADTLCGAL
jgi:hypothetical protein